MATGFSQSDIIAIAVGAAQIVVTVVVSIWAVHRTTKSEQSEDRQSPKPSSVWSSFFRETWLFWLFAGYGIYELASLAQLPSPLTGGQVVKAVFFGCYVLFNVFAPLLFWGFIQTFEILLRLSGVQRDMLGNQQGVLSVIKDALTAASTRTRRKRRAG
jgi:hypothetical protein